MPPVTFKLNELGPAIRWRLLPPNGKLSRSTSPAWTLLEKRRARNISGHRDRDMGIDETGTLSSQDLNYDFII